MQIYDLYQQNVPGAANFQCLFLLLFLHIEFTLCHICGLEGFFQTYQMSVFNSLIENLGGNLCHAVGH